METEINDSAAPATKADIATVRGVTEAIDAATEELIQTLTWRMTVMWASTVAAIIGTRTAG